jgi:hypothetical protein
LLGAVFVRGIVCCLAALLTPPPDRYSFSTGAETLRFGPATLVEVRRVFIPGNNAGVVLLVAGDAHGDSRFQLRGQRRLARQFPEESMMTSACLDDFSDY